MTTTVAELRRAWAAVGSGEFTDLVRPNRGMSVWTPAEGERVLPVVGAHGLAGASTVALAIATVAAPARVIECAPTSTSGLVGAATAELGRVGEWLQGRRDDVVLERWATDDTVAAPLPTELRTTVLDSGTGLGHDEPTAWVQSALDASNLVVVGVASLPGIRRVQQALRTATRAWSCVVALRGPRPQRCPRYIRRAIDELKPVATVVHVPDNASLRLRGVDTSPLPPLLLAAAEQILTVAEQSWRREAS